MQFFPDGQNLGAELTALPNAPTLPMRQDAHEEPGQVSIRIKYAKHRQRGNGKKSKRVAGLRGHF